MKSFQKFISEEVLPTAMVQDGNFDLRNEAVRDQINSILGGICSRSHVTPYITLCKVSKALSYFSIILPKKTFLEGRRGVEVYEMVQFGEKMGMNDSGEFIREVPPKFYLFFDYRNMLGMFTCMAKVVDKAELDKMLDMFENSVNECADDKVTASQRNAEKEPMHDVTSDPKKKGNKEAVADSKKGLNEVSLGKLIRYRRGAEQELGDIKHFKKQPGQYPAATSDDKKRAERSEKTREKGISLAHKKMTGKAKVGASAPKHPYMEEHIEEARLSDRFVANVKKGDDKTMNAIKNAVSGYNKAHGTKHRADAAGRLGKDNPNASKYGDKRKGKLSRSKIRQGDAASSDVYLRPRERDYSKPDLGNKENDEHTRKIKLGIANKLKKKNVKEETLDELSKDTLKSYIKKAGKSKVAHSQSLDNLSSVTHQFNSATEREIKKGRSHVRKMKNRRIGIERASDRLEEKAPPGAKFERMVKHIKKGYSKDGLTAKEKSIAYATAWKAKKKETD